MTAQLQGALGIKTADGTIVPVLDFQSQRWSQMIFTTIADRQRKALFQFYYRDRDSARWEYLDSLPLKWIPSARAGEPELKVNTQINGQGYLSVEIYEPGKKKNACFVLPVGVLSGRLDRRQTRPSSSLSFRTPPDQQHSVDTQGNKLRSRKGRWIVSLLALFSIFLVVFILVLRPRLIDSDRTELENRVKEYRQTKPERTEAMISTTGRSTRIPAETSDRGDNTMEGSTEKEPVIQREPEWSSYNIQWGDTLWRIAEGFYGDRGLYSELADSNRLANPDIIISGDSLQLPPAINGKQRGSTDELGQPDHE